jgi:chemotaxis protein methyltransferase CheR
MREELISSILERIQHETGIVLSRTTDRSRIARYLDNGGIVPQSHEPLPDTLINLITTNETYFERESHHFNRLMAEILPEIDRSGDSAKAIRILCAPSSSGEEPYTIALRVLESAQKFRRPIEIIGIDISSEMIIRAQAGIYSERSVHTLSREILERYFIPVQQGYQIRPLNGVSIRFHTGNLFDLYLWDKIGDFDIIFSRNMMIYFDHAKNKELLKRFKGHLDGYLILGHADDHIQAKEFFTPVRNERGVVYRT